MLKRMQQVFPTGFYMGFVLDSCLHGSLLAAPQLVRHQVSLPGRDSDDQTIQIHRHGMLQVASWHQCFRQILTFNSHLIFDSKPVAVPNLQSHVFVLLSECTFLRG